MANAPSQPSSQRLIRGLLSAMMSGLLLESAPALAQLIPDQSLPENSRLLQDGSLMQVEGGTQAGGNLFHSFQEFSIPQDLHVHFNNAASIERIITRVTGGEISRLDGHLSANGAAGFILINPQGVEFGESARLSLGGLFIATTAEGVQFADGSLWGASAADRPTLLTVSAPVGVQFGDRPGAIVNRSLALDDQGTPMGLGALRLSLLGGEVRFEGGQARSPLSVEVASFAPGSFAGLDAQGRIGEVNPEGLGRIQLSQGGGIGGGAIRLLGDRLEMTQGAQVVS
ncbi:filamentous hemagglutinin N-terminal domain-containing protein, partial [Geitlerinema sp. P-1104]|uniref:filamentous hemagglutinin N-terminal domain-containing protein n=1 Tax=Geitlerinema sp. P-1104 TaxID=2546230 RepID=UPI001476CF25